MTRIVFPPLAVFVRGKDAGFRHVYHTLLLSLREIEKRAILRDNDVEQFDALKDALQIQEFTASDHQQAASAGLQPLESSDRL